MSVDQVVKRDGRVVPFDRSRIERAIYAAARAVGNGEGRPWAEMLSWAVVGILEERYGQKSQTPQVEEVQDIVEEVLIKSGHPTVAKAYILYRQKRADARAAERMLMDTEKLVDDYLQKLDWRIAENSNMNYSLQGLNFYLASSIAARYWLDKIYPPEVQRAHTEGAVHIHDLGMLSSYTYYGKEVVVLRVDGALRLTSFEQAYASCPEVETCLNEADAAFAKYPQNWDVLDQDGWTPVRRLVRKRKYEGMRFIKNRGGRSVIVTDNHPMITGSGAVRAADVTPRSDALYTVDLQRLLSGEDLFVETEIDLLAELKKAGITRFGKDYIYLNGVPIADLDLAQAGDGILHTHTRTIPRRIPLTADLGYFIGFVLAEGYLCYDAKAPRTISISQKDPNALHAINRALIALGTPGCITPREGSDMFDLQIRSVFLRFLFEQVFAIQPGARHKTLPERILHYNPEFVHGVLAGVIDGDGSLDGNGTSVIIRVSARTLLEQMACVLQLLGATPRDRNIEGVGSSRVYKGREVDQRYPLYGVSFRKTPVLDLPSTRFEVATISAHAWQDESRDEWHTVLNNEPTEIPDDDIYDITTESGTLVVNGMWNHNCSGWDLQDLLMQGFGGVSAKIESRPPRHLRTALGQLVNFFYTLQGEVAGAVAVSNLDTLLAPFIRYDRLDYTGIKQAVQEFVFNINVPTRVGFQSLVWDELVVIKNRGRIEVVEIGQLVDGQFDRNGHRILSQGHSSYAVANADDYRALTFDVDGQVHWAPVKAFIRHRVPQGSTFVRVRTSRGTAGVSQAHSMFAFAELNGHCTAQPIAANQVQLAHGNATLSPHNHLVAVRRVANEGSRRQLDLVELIDAVPQLAERVRVRLPDHAMAVSRLQQRARERFGGLTAFYLEYGLKDKGCWKQWEENRSLPYRVWRSLGEDEAAVEFSLRNSDLWYGRYLAGDGLEEFVRLLGWYIAEGHNDISNGLYISQARGGNQEEMARVLGALGALGRVEEMQGWSPQNNPTSVVLRMAGKGLLASLVSYLAGTYSTNKIIPWFIYDLAPDLQEMLIATLMRGDGSDFPGHFDYTTTSKKLSLGLSLLLAMNGYKFSVYENRYDDRPNWSDQYTLRIYKDKAAREGYDIGDLLARACTHREAFSYQREYEYDISVDAACENFAGGSGLLCFHNTPFTNITMDLTPPSTLRDQAVVIGGELQEATYGEFQEEMGLFNRAFAEVMLEGDSKNRVFTFPIPTINVTRDFDWHDPNLEPMWKMTAKYGIPYFSNYINSDMNPEDARSMCPLHPDTEVIVRAGRGVFIRTIKEVYYTYKRKGTKHEVLFDGEWYQATPVAVQTEGCLEFTIGNGEKVSMDCRHEQPVKRGKGQPAEILQAGQIGTGMYLPFNATPLSEEMDNYDAGFAVGAYIGDGSYEGNGAILFSLNGNEKEANVAHRLKAFFVRSGFTVTQNPQKRHVVTLRVGGSGTAAEAWISQFVSGRTAHEKELTPRAFQMGQHFLHGILDGWYGTDGGNRGRIYTVSAKLCRDFSVLCGLLGKAYKIDHQGDVREGRYSDGQVYTLKFHNRTSYGQHFFYEDGLWWYPVESIRRVEDYNGLVFCFAVDSDEHLFQLANGLITHNCRLRLDHRELRKRMGGLFAAAPLTGSAGVVTINLPRLAYLAHDEDDFRKQLEQMMEISRTSLEIKRKMLETLTDRGLYPYSRHYLHAVKAQTGGYWNHHFSTIGLIGTNEACLNLLGVGIADPKGKAFAVRMLEFMREVIFRFQQETGNLYNLEATPAEGASYRLARADKQAYPSIKAAGTEKTPYYTNSSQLPVNYSDDLFEVLDHQDDLQTLYTGGTVVHIFLGEQLNDWRQARRLVRTVAENYRLPYFTLSPTFSICPVHGYIPGEHKYCPYEHTEEDLAKYGRVVEGGE